MIADHVESRARLAFSSVLLEYKVKLSTQTYLE